MSGAGLHVCGRTLRRATTAFGKDCRARSSSSGFGMMLVIQRSFLRTLLPAVLFTLSCKLLRALRSTWVDVCRALCTQNPTCCTRSSPSHIRATRAVNPLGNYSFSFFSFFVSSRRYFSKIRERIDMTQSNLTYIHVIFSVRYPLHCSFPCTLPCATFLSLPLPFRFLSIRFFLYLNHPFLPLSLSPPLSLPPATWLPHRRFRRGFRCCCVGVP